MAGAASRQREVMTMALSEPLSQLISHRAAGIAPTRDGRESITEKSRLRFTCRLCGRRISKG